MTIYSLNYESKKAARCAMEIPGQIRESEAAYLYRMARRKGNFVEIGCLFGRSTSVLVRAAEVFGAHLTTVDPFFKTPNTDLRSSPELWQENLRQQGLAPPDLLQMPSHEAAQVYQFDISFLFIDGGHGYETVKQDIEDWIPKVRVSGVVAFHDMYMPHISGVTRAVNEWWLDMFDRDKEAWKIEGMVDYMIAFRRRA